MPELWSEFLPHPWNLVAGGAAAAALLFGFIGLSAFLGIWAERKVSARMQDRLGPTRVGPFGLLQSLADGVKLIAKEDVAPQAADKLLFRAAPYIAFCASFCGFLALPFGSQFVAQNLSVGAFFVLAVLSSEVFGIVLAGYASASKWSLFGGVREAAQVVSYEVPRAMCVVVPVCLAGTLNLNTIGAQQVGWFWNWNVFHDPFTFVAFFVFFITAVASCKRAPFDLAEAESELVAGFHTEYSGIRWSYFFLAEYGSMFAVSGLAALLFLGGWHSGVLPFEPSVEFGFWPGTVLNVAVFVGKCWALVLVMIWMRWSLPRLRIDQVMTTCLKYFLPISCVLLIGVCLWLLMVPAAVTNVVRYALSFGCLALVLGVGASLFRSPVTASARAGELPGAWARR
ncbi:NADH-quinone oxidoreductase subunit H [Gemmata obscuriglobus]|uniref:NADH-quinone oxidoreductase subunit H n=1 Tax=Gemmata obscuriglobus TaxID=114 RepID=A0A2Z3HKE0_9BACT|nr:NADH-quinone oxidoreductase subunit NuoH [Gemmata obscuriglobus]AWM42294.1 NADH-quinone oxidoreductase subunit NuoH [Gemmata obscuriglobus]QEG28387.1 NADH-quinone oxidoreductase subunit H [Gemmata obscuriglobus]VTS06311.1 nadh dehydrogenase : NADH-quinone oxidoreductase subunit H OS=Pirellula staleyi (strain ATCC 27377 / DSM 6068 / ICPB 4128) GN=nuoH PE=3 SV=1: NADHdh [Gemmata obscuriglobus UQM 2246]